MVWPHTPTWKGVAQTFTYIQGGHNLFSKIRPHRNCFQRSPYTFAMTLSCCFSSYLRASFCRETHEIRPAPYQSVDFDVSKFWGKWPMMRWVFHLEMFNVVIFFFRFVFFLLSHFFMIKDPNRCGVTCLLATLLAVITRHPRQNHLWSERFTGPEWGFLRLLTTKRPISCVHRNEPQFLCDKTKSVSDPGWVGILVAARGVTGRLLWQASSHKRVFSAKLSGGQTFTV